MSKIVILTVGAPASGKSTWARKTAADQEGKYVVVSRDDIRKANGFPNPGTKAQETLVTRVQRGIIETALLDGIIPIVADTNINKQFRKHLIKFCHEHGAEVQLVLFHRDLDTLLSWNDGREDEVPEDVIRRMHQQFTKQINDGEFTEVVLPVQSFEPYKHEFASGSKNLAYVFDIDGTVAKMNGRSPYDYSRVGEDLPMQDVLDTAIALDEAGYHIIFVSGRDGSCRPDTEAWLDRHYDSGYELFMREAGDQRPDWVIKNEIYDRELIPNYNIIGVFDDRDQVVRHLRNRGITVFQVAPGRF